MNKNPAYSIGAVHSSDRFGEFTIIGNPNSERMRIKFTNTGYERVANRDSIKRGEVHDHLAPTVFGIGCLGDGLPKPKTSLNRWRNILARFARGTSHGRLDLAGSTSGRSVTGTSKHVKM
ncbi:hypothetical protein JCM19241_5985 [Vibrio ishigakensis]|uniref:Uncharacterized protein n=1 Tax=Vibrio ishigakensis TaxID=1481914 RepID=A0A0B8QS70_9VIBR|nr:hypothetical protein JCM19241_5985 [Vibrio ishigakensis]